MRDKILGLIQAKPKHYAAIIKRDEQMMSWINANSLIDGSLTERIRSAVYGESNICQYGNAKTLTSINEGWRNCGKASTCQCTRDTVSSSVSLSKANRTTDQIEKENQKRVQTNLSKYGVSNTGQTSKALQSHRNFYCDKGKVNDAVNKQEQTMVKLYGVTNAAHLAEVKDKKIKTTLERYGVENIAQSSHARQQRSIGAKRAALSGVFKETGYNRFSDYVRSTYNFELLTTLDQYGGIHSKDALSYTFKCLGCSTIVDKKFHHNRGINCDICNPIPPQFTSGQEVEVFNFITGLGIVGVQGDRSLINPYELDMVFHSHRIAIEFCGLYWHSENGGNKNRDRNYHNMKMRLVEQSGYRLITIFSDEWEGKRDIVCSRLMSLFGMSEHKVYARKCEVKIVDYHTTKSFMIDNHLQGWAQSKINLGLYYQNELVSIMTFGSKRKVLNSVNRNDTYELVRFASKLGYNVVGGASKLLKHFVRSYNPSEIVSYADLRWSNGGVYRQLGFTPVEDYTIGYWYVENYSVRHHRYNFRKQELVKLGFDSSKTEWEIMMERGYDRIWDCGQQKFELVLDKQDKQDIQSVYVNNDEKNE